MKKRRFASHYLFLPGIGFIKEQVVELDGEYLSSTFPLTLQELPSVEWEPGVIVITGEKENNWPALFSQTPLSIEPPSPVIFSPHTLYAYVLYPFDFKEMKPVAETQHRLLP